MLKVTCPECSSTNIVGNDHVCADAHISGWGFDADGQLEPEWSGVSEVDWDSQEPLNPMKPYACDSCYRVWAASELKVEEVADETTAD